MTLKVANSKVDKYYYPSISTVGVLFQLSICLIQIISSGLNYVSFFYYFFVSFMNICYLTVFFIVLNRIVIWVVFIFCWISKSFGGLVYLCLSKICAEVLYLCMFTNNKCTYN